MFVVQLGLQNQADFTNIYGEFFEALYFHVCWISGGQETGCFCKWLRRKFQGIIHFVADISYRLHLRSGLV
jgi:hypothetical protein